MPKTTRARISPATFSPKLRTRREYLMNRVHKTVRLLTVALLGKPPSTESEQGSVLAPLPSDASDIVWNAAKMMDPDSRSERPNCEQTPLWKLDKANKTPRA